jgi:hypothetical protein
MISPRTRMCPSRSAGLTPVATVCTAAALRVFVRQRAEWCADVRPATLFTTHTHS